MKRIFSLAATVAVISLSLVACSEKPVELGHYTTETSGPAPKLEGFNEITVLGAEAIQLSDEETFKLSWEVGDMISVYESEGEWVADLKIKDAAAAVSVFAVEGEVRLDDDTRYVAVYPARQSSEATMEEYLESISDMNAEQTQVGGTFDHIKDEVFMKVDFKGSSPITFGILKSVAVINFSVEDSATPAAITLDGGSELQNYTLYLDPATKVNVSHRAYMVLNITPASNEERPLVFSVQSEDGSEIFSKEISTKIGFNSGEKYNIDLDNGTIGEQEGGGNEGGDTGEGDKGEGDTESGTENLLPETGEWV